MKISDDKNVSVKHNFETNNKYNFKHLKMSVNIHNKQYRTIDEPCIIFNF